MTITASVLWVDAAGGRTITRINTAGGVATIKADMLLCSNADWLELWESNLAKNGSPSPVSASYLSSSIRAVLVFQCADGTQVSLILVSPDLSVFQADGETIDAANAGISTLIGDCIANLQSNTGSPAVSYLSGALLPRTKAPL